MDKIDILLGHIDDLAEKAIKIGYAASRFLTPAEAGKVASKFARRHDVSLVFDGGYDGAENTRAILLNTDWGKYDRDKLFKVVKLEYHKQFSLGHRNILGSLMALGIERDTIGDIIAKGSTPAYIVCLPEMAKYIIENLTMVGRVTVMAIGIDLDNVPVRDEDIIFKTDTVASVRLDAVLSTAFGLSRNKAVELIEAGRVSLNHEECLQRAKEVSEGAILSVRGLGRAKLFEVGGTSKKGRIFIKTGLYR